MKLTSSRVRSNHELDLGIEHLETAGRAWSGRRRVVHRRECKVGPADARATIAQLGERLRRRHLMNEMEVDVEDRGGARRFGADQVVRPDLFEESPWWSHLSSQVINCN